MRTAYLGMADNSGLRILIPETEHAGRFLTKRAARLNAVCFWTVIDEAIYVSICNELQNGDLVGGLILVQLFADEIGTILPGTFDRDERFGAA